MVAGYGCISVVKCSGEGVIFAQCYCTFFIRFNPAPVFFHIIPFLNKIANNEEISRTQAPLSPEGATLSTMTVSVTALNYRIIDLEIE
jgi:hypothetical protein